MITPFDENAQNGQHNKAAACTSKAPYRPENHSLRLPNMKNKEWKWLHFLCAQVRLPDAYGHSIPQKVLFVH